jgi:hypothetical protein
MAKTLKIKVIDTNNGKLFVRKCVDNDRDWDINLEMVGEDGEGNVGVSVSQFLTKKEVQKLLDHLLYT